jgi:two-component system, NarL family, sensor histidine kinase UhpB
LISTQIVTRPGTSLSKRLIQGSLSEILVFDALTHKVVEASRSARSNLRYTLQALQKLAIQDILVRQNNLPMEWAQPSAGMDLSGIQVFDCSVRRKDGTTYPAEAWLFPTRDSDRSLYVAIINDLSIREASRRALDQRESDFQALVSNIPGMAYQVLRAPDGTVSFPFVSTNSRMLLGVKPQALQANPGLLLELIIPEDRDSYRKALADANGCHMSFNWEGRIWVEAWKDVKWINIRTSRRKTASGRIWDGIMLNITQSKLAKEELERSKEELRLLALHIQHVKEEERKRIAQEIHDELGGNLTAIKIGVSWLRRNEIRDQFKSEERLRFLEEVIDNTMDAIHRISNDLRPAILDFGIVSAIRWQAEQLGRTTGVECRFFSGLEQIPLDDEAAVAVFRIAQEAMTNIAKHSKATLVEVSLGMTDDRIQLDISDNGIGPQVVGAPNRKRSFGVMGMNERASALGGKLSVEPRPGGGTMVRLEIPIVSNQTGADRKAGSSKTRRHGKSLKKA